MMNVFHSDRLKFFISKNFDMSIDYDKSINTLLIICKKNRARFVGGDRELGHSSIFENPEWVTYQNAQNCVFRPFEIIFGEKFSGGALGAAKNIENRSIFAQKWITFKMFAAFGAEEWVTYRV